MATNQVCTLTILSVREKKLLLSGDNFGRDLLGVQTLQKKHQQFEAELASHDTRKESLLSLGQKLSKDSPNAREAIDERCSQLEGVWDDLVQASGKRRNKLEEALQYQRFCVGLDEEEAWLNEKTVLISNEDNGDTLATVQVSALSNHAYLVHHKWPCSPFMLCMHLIDITIHTMSLVL